MSKIDIFVIILLFYVGWFGSVFLAKTEYSNAALFFPLILIGYLLFKNHLNGKRFSLAMAICILGILFDSFTVWLGFISAIGITGFFIPTWLISIWMLFSFSMIKLGTRVSPPVWLAAILGFLIGPLSYKSGEIFKVLAFTTPLTFFIYAIFWALMFPTTLFLSKRFA